MVDHIAYDETNRQTVVKFNNNVIFDTEGSMVFRSGAHTIIKTGSNKTGLLFLNPDVENSDSVDDIITESLYDQQRKYSDMVSKQNISSDDPCGI